MSYTVIHFIFMQKNFCDKIFCMIYVNDCSIRVVQPCIIIFVQEIFLPTDTIILKNQVQFGIIEIKPPCLKQSFHYFLLL